MLIVPLYFRDIFVHKTGIRIISKIYPGLGIIQKPPSRASYLYDCVLNIQPYMYTLAVMWTTSPGFAFFYLYESKSVK